MRLLLSGSGLLLLLSLAGCGSEQAAAKTAPYADLNDVYTRVSEAQEQLAAGLSEAADAPRVATVLKTYTSKMREIGPLLSAAQEKYPELREAETPPAELTAVVAKLNTSTGKMMESLSKVQQFLDDPVVTAAMDDLQKAAQEQAN